MWHVSMETLKSQNILPNIDPEDLTRSHTQIFTQTIDNPRDHGLKRRENLWSFQHKNRGIQAKVKGIEIKPPEKSDDFDENCGTEEEIKEKVTKRFQLPKLKPKIRLDCSMSSCSDEPATVKREYSSALRIGNNLYEQLRIKQNLMPRANSQKQRPVLKSTDKLPDVSSSLSKLGYLKAAKNVVHYGGGFFGRTSTVDRRYIDFRRSSTVYNHAEQKTTTNDTDIQIDMKRRHGNLQQDENVKGKDSNSDKEGDKNDKALMICSSDLTEKISEEKRTINYPKMKSKKSKEDLIELEMISDKYCIDFCKSDPETRKNIKIESEEHLRRNEAWQRDIDLIVARKHRKDSENNKSKNQNSKINTKSVGQIELSVNQEDRPESNVSLDIPEHQFGPSSYKPEDNINKTLNATYCINPYKWTSRSSLTDCDRVWVEKAMEKTEIVDSTIYDVFARKKSKSNLKNEHIVKEKSSMASKQT